MQAAGGESTASPSPPDWGSGALSAIYQSARQDVPTGEDSGMTPIGVTNCFPIGIEGCSTRNSPVTLNSIKSP